MRPPELGLSQWHHDSIQAEIYIPIVQNFLHSQFTSNPCIDCMVVSKQKSNRRNARRVAEESPRFGETNRGKFRFVDLFCGIGGFRIAFERAGCRCVWSCDSDKYARITYKANFGDEPCGDIHNVAVADIPSHDILCAGFPCQPFSIAGVSKKLSLGRKHGFDDEKQGNLFFEIANILEYHKPRAFILENVKHLLSHDKGRTFEIIRTTLTEALGYTLYSKVIDARSVVPQHRERVFLVGFRESRPFQFPKFPESGPQLASILDSQIEGKYTLSDHLWSYLQAYARKHAAKGNGFGYSVFKRNQVARTLSARYYKDGSEILIDQGARQNPRRLTPRECARLMGYSNAFKISVSDTQAYKQFGNSVVVPIIEALALSVVKGLRGSASIDNSLRQTYFPLAAVSL